MHLAEGILPWQQAVATSVAAVPLIVYGIRASRGASTGQVGMATALLFAVTLFPVPVPVTGMTSHMCATPILGLLFGPARMIVPTALVLLLQALFFAHGGLSTLGANLLTLGFVGPICALGLARLLRTAGLKPVFAVAVACAIGDLAVYVADACLLATVLVPRSQMPVAAMKLLVAMAPAQLPLALLEGFLSAALLAGLAKRDPTRIPVWLRPRFAPIGRHVGATILFVLITMFPVAVRASAWQGLDDSVLAKAAREKGREPAPLFDLESGELGKALFGGAMLVVGYFLGVGWKGLNQNAKRAP